MNSMPALPMPLFYEPHERPIHPFIQDYARTFNFDQYFETHKDVRRAVAGYLGLCSFMDEHAGKVHRVHRPASAAIAGDRYP